jgi:hypothetical protein
MPVDNAQRHFLDKTDIDAVIDRELNQTAHFQMVSIFENDRVDFYPLKASALTA